MNRMALARPAAGERSAALHPNHDDHPEIEARYLSAEIDRLRVRAAVRVAR